MTNLEKEFIRINKMYDSEIENAKMVLSGNKLKQQIAWLEEDREKAMTLAERNAKFDVVHISPYNGKRTVIRHNVNIWDANEAFYGISNTEIVEL